MSNIIRNESAHSINGVPGRMLPLHRPPAPWVSGVFANQKWISESRAIKGYGAGGKIQVEIRFDDDCRNGRNSFSITANVTTHASLSRHDTAAGGCLHDDIALVFPELAPLIRWHLCATDGPMHYIANTVYHASDRDHHGLRKGESRQIKNGRTGLPAWRLETRFFDANGNEVAAPEKSIDSETQPIAPNAVTAYVPWCRVGDGKERQLNFARSAACWPEATDAELMAEPEELKAALLARLPALLDAMRADIEAAGFMWECPAA